MSQPVGPSAPDGPALRPEDNHQPSPVQAQAQPDAAAREDRVRLEPELIIAATRRPSSSSREFDVTGTVELYGAEPREQEVEEDDVVEERPAPRTGPVLVVAPPPPAEKPPLPALSVTLPGLAPRPQPEPRQPAPPPPAEGLLGPLSGAVLAGVVVGAAAFLLVHSLGWPLSHSS